MPLVFYYGFGKNLTSAGNGFVVGSIISIILWYIYGRNLIKEWRGCDGVVMVC